MKISYHILGIGIFTVLIGSAVIVIGWAGGGEPAFSSLRGHFLIEVEAKGQGWYVLPERGKRIFLGKPYDAFVRLRDSGKPVTSDTLNRIPKYGSAHARLAEGSQNAAQARYRGSVVIRADSAPYDAWYVHPETAVRYPLSSPYDAWNLIATLGIGISHDHITKIPVAVSDDERHPLFFEALPSAQRTIIPGRAPEWVSRGILSRIDAFARDPSTRKTLADGYLFIVIDGISALVSTRYGRWFILNDDEGKAFTVLDSIGGLGTYRQIREVQMDTELAVSGIYIPAEQERPLFLVRHGNRIGTLSLDIVASETLYPTLDAESVSIMSGWRSSLFSGPLLKDDSSLYALRDGLLVHVVGADHATLQLWPMQDSTLVFGDTYGVYATDRKGLAYRIFSEDPLTFSLNDDSYYTDPQTGRIRRALRWSEEDVEQITNGIIQKDGALYLDSPHVNAPTPLDGIDPESFFSIPNTDDALLSDGNRIFYRVLGNPTPSLITLSSLDAASFEFLAKTEDGILLKDVKGVYSIRSIDGELVPVAGAHPKTFHIVYADQSMIIAKDARHVYSGMPMELVEAADASSFHVVFTVEDFPFGRDRDHIFTVLPGKRSSLRLLPEADQSSYVVYSLPLDKHAFSSHTSNNGRSSYAIDRRWVWLYDIDSSGIVRIYRADPHERISQEQILDFARIYLRFTQ